MDILKKPLSEGTVKLIQTYDEIARAVADTDDLDAKVRVCSNAIGMCESSKDSIKKSKILYWTHNNIADSLVRKNDNYSGYDFDRKYYQDALEHYNGALKSAYENKEKASTLNKIAHVYKNLGDMDAWLQAHHSRIGTLNNHNKKRAYIDLLEHVREDRHAVEVLEKALEYVQHERVSEKVKCKNAKDICMSLIALYERMDDRENLARVQYLYDAADRKHLLI